MPTGTVYKQALDAGLPKERVRITGLPVHPNIALEKREQATIRQGLGWDTSMTTALIVGSARSREMTSMVQLLDRSGLDLQLVAVAGGNTEMESSLRQTTYLQD